MSTINARELGIVTMTWMATDESGSYGCIVGMVDGLGQLTTDPEQAVQVVAYDASTNDFVSWEGNDWRERQQQLTRQ